MPNLYLCEPRCGHATLRAILSWNEWKSILRKKTVTYLGKKFPRVSPGQDETKEFAVIGVPPGEASAEWNAGFYCLHEDSGSLDEAFSHLPRAGKSLHTERTGRTPETEERGVFYAASASEVLSAG